MVFVATALRVIAQAIAKSQSPACPNYFVPFDSRKGVWCTAGTLGMNLARGRCVVARRRRKLVTFFDRSDTLRAASHVSDLKEANENGSQADCRSERAEKDGR